MVLLWTPDAHRKLHIKDWPVHFDISFGINYVVTIKGRGQSTSFFSVPHTVCIVSSLRERN